jgi:solute carrier family 25 (adenine nucleotide translocator) protein 4/5/6/31
VAGLLGHSKGGTDVVLYAAKYDDIPRVVNVSGRFDNQRGAAACRSCHHG